MRILHGVYARQNKQNYIITQLHLLGNYTGKFAFALAFRLPSDNVMCSTRFSRQESVTLAYIVQYTHRRTGTVLYILCRLLSAPLNDSIVAVCA